jgi:hypothetical protein
MSGRSHPGGSPDLRELARAGRAAKPEKTDESEETKP